MDLGIGGKRALVCAGSKGLGRGCAEALAAEGVEIVLNARSLDVLESTAEEIRRTHNVSVTTIAADVTTDEGRQQILDHAEAIDILVNNAALFAALRFTPIMEMSNDDWDRVMKVNVRGTLQTTKAVVPSMIEGGGGKIINISSGTFYYGGPGLAHYVCSKGAIIAFTRSASREFADKNILVNCIAPGLTVSEGVENHPDLHVAREPTVQSRAIKREMMPEDINGTLLFLASDDSDFITGQTYNVDGGKYNQ